MNVSAREVTVTPLDRALRDVFLDTLTEGNGRILPSDADREISLSIGRKPGTVMDAVMRCSLADQR